MIRRACEKDIEKIEDLLIQVCNVHHEGRPDVFKGNTTKYDRAELMELLADDSRPIFVATDEEDRVQGYALCIFKVTEESRLMMPMKSLYIDDLCVEQTLRGQHIGKKLYEYVLDFARENDCYNVTLNVWHCNERALRFYESCGLLPMNTRMEKILK